MTEQLSEDLKLWYSRVKKDIENERYGYCVSWHLRIFFGESTSKINRHLNKLVNKGYLTKESQRSCTKYFLTDKKISN